jgi:hypothetical protein
LSTLGGNSVDVFMSFIRPERCFLSLLDVAILVGDRRLAKTLSTLGVPQKLSFEFGNFYDRSTGLLNAKRALIVEAA